MEAPSMNPPDASFTNDHDPEGAADGTGEVLQPAEGPADVRVDMPTDADGSDPIANNEQLSPHDSRTTSLMTNVVMRLKQYLFIIFSKGLVVLKALGNEKIIKLVLGFTAQMTGSLTATYFTTSNGHLPKRLLYSAAGANTVAFICCGVGFALSRNEPRGAIIAGENLRHNESGAASIIGGIGTLFAIASFLMIMSLFIPNW